VAALILALSGTLVHLAGTTSLLLLIVFISVNLALLTIRRRHPEKSGGIRIPILVPIVAAFSSAALICFVPLTSLFWGAIILALGGLLVLISIRKMARPDGQVPASLGDTASIAVNRDSS
jgi:amino acid transporter